MDITQRSFGSDDEKGLAPGQAIHTKIRQEPGRMKQTHISINGYEMHQMELLDRGLIAIQRTEDAFIDINNRIISNVNSRKDRLNTLNSRIQNLAQKTMKLFNCPDPMRVESPADYPKITTSKAANMHPHQSIFYDRQNIFDDQEMNAERKNQIEYNLPELSSMQMKKKIFNTRLSNNFENLGTLVTGVTKDINEISSVLLSLERYG